MTANHSIPRRQFGRLGFSVCTLGVGGVWLGRFPDLDPDEQDAIAISAVHRAIEVGLDYLDTSPLYGESERRIGLALSQPHPEGGRWRDRIRLVTKAGTHPKCRGDFSAATIRWSVENSLKLLQTDHLDAVLIHDPTEMAPVLAPGGGIEALCQMKDEGIIGGTGIGVRDHPHLLAAIEDGRFDIIQTTYDYSLLRTIAMDEIVPKAEAKGLALINASPYQSGLLAAGSLEKMEEVEGKRHWASTADDLENSRKLYRWAAEEGLDLTALALQFSLREERLDLTLVGPKTAAEVDDNIRAAQVHFPEETWAKLDAFLKELGTLR